MRPIVMAALLLLTFSSCEKERNTIEGQYSGTFQRYVPDLPVVPRTSNVTVQFTGEHFSGTSDSSNYPAICSGTYAIEQGLIKASNGCMFTANFAWTLIFNGDYQYAVKGDSLRIWRDYDGERDLYLLKKASN